MVRRLNKKKKILNKVKFAEKLRNNLPKSELWFWELWIRSGMMDPEDKSNEIVCGYIPDVFNKKFNYIIEIDGDIHSKRKVKNRDFIKNKVFTKSGYELFRINAYDYDHFGILCDKIQKIRDLKNIPPKPKTILRTKENIFWGDKIDFSKAK